MTKKTKKIGLISFAAASALAISVAAGVAKTDTTLTVSANTGTVTLGTTEVDLSNFVTYYGASIRANANTPGLRFKSGIPASEYAKITAIEGVTLGTLIVPADLLEENEEIKFENLAQGEYADCVAVNFETNDPDKTGNVEFSGVLTKIKDYNINRSFRSRAYIKYQPTGESTPTYYYSNYYSTKAEDTIVETFDNARSVSNVAYTASNDTEYTYKDEQYDMFDSFIAYRPNALTEDFERTISDVRAYGVYAATGTTASILTENAVNGNHSLLLDGTNVKAAVQTPMLANIVNGGKLTLKATSAVSLTDMENTAFSATVSEQTAEGYYNVTLSAEDTQKVVSDYGFIIECTESVTIDDITVTFESVTPNGKTTMQDALDTTFGNLNVKTSNLQQVLTSGNSTVAATTVLQKGGTYTANATVSADGYNDETVSVSYKVDANYQKSYNSYSDLFAPTAIVQNDGATVTVDTNTTRKANDSSTFTLETDATHGDVLKIRTNYKTNAAVFNYNAVDVSAYDSLRVLLKTELSDTVTTSSWCNVYVSFNGINVGTLIGQPKEGWIEVAITKSAYASALAEGKYLNQIALYSTSGGVTTTFYLGCMQFVNEHAIDYSRITQVPYGSADVATLATVNETQALKIVDTNNPIVQHYGKLPVKAGQVVVMEISSLTKNASDSTVTKISVQYNNGSKNTWKCDITNFTANYQLVQFSFAADDTLSYIQFVPNDDKNCVIYVKSICIVDKVTPNFDATAGATTTLDFSNYPVGTVFTNMLGSVRELNGQKMLCVPMGSTNANTLFYTFADGESVATTDTLTISIAQSTNGFNVGSASGKNDIGYSNATNTGKDITKTGIAVSTIYFKQYSMTAYGYIWIKSITVTRGA